MFSKNQAKKISLINQYIPKRLKRISLGYRLKDKLKLLIIAVVEYLSEIPFIFLAEDLKKISSQLWRGTIVEIDGIKYFLVDSESFSIISPKFENFVFMWFKPAKDEILLDIGAHIGKYSLTTARNVGAKGVIVAVEPHPVNFKALQKNIELNNLKNVVALNIAAWNADCKLNLFIGDIAGHHSAKVNRGLGFVKVNARAMDDVVRELNLPKINWIKIDVEGAEFEVLCGLSETIKKYKPKIIIEITKKNLDKVKEFMKKQEYQCIRISVEDFFCIYN